MPSPLLDTGSPATEQQVNSLLGSEAASPQQTIERLRAELSAERANYQQLKQDFDLLESALNTAPSEFTISKMVEPANIIVFCNRARAENLGYTREELVGQPVTKLFAQPQIEEAHALRRAQLAKGETLHYEDLALRKDGSTYLRGSALIPLPDKQGNIVHCLSIGADITARVEAERKQRELQEQLVNEMKERERIAIELRLAQKLESVGRLAAGVAHEINTPIQFVNDSLYFLRSAFDDLLRLLEAGRAAHHASLQSNDVEPSVQAMKQAEQEADLDFLLDEIPKAFDRTFEGATRVASIVRAMKEFAHPDNNEHAPADINHALQTTLIVASNEYKYVATMKTQFTELPAVTCNIGELNQVFLNLIVNASHAIHDAGKDASSGGEITISTAVVGDNVEITFADNGCGIPQEHLDKIYDPFFTTKEVGRGTGQGLAITRSIVIEKHGGEIRVTSAVGAGTQFTLCLPINGKGKGE